LCAVGDVTLIWPFEGGVISDSYLFEKRLNQKALGYPLRSVLVVKFFRKLFGVFAWGPALSMSPSLTRYLATHIKTNFPPGTIVIVSHPWLGRVIKYLEDYPTVYFAHNIESEIIQESNLGFFHKIFLKKYVSNLEIAVANMADKVAFVSHKDQTTLVKYLKEKPTKVVGVGASLPIPSPATKNNSALFVGGDYLFNFEAAELLIEIASKMPGMKFVIVGEVCKKISSNLENVTLMGWVTEEHLNAILNETSLFVNPMQHGSGIHLKLIKAMAYNVPILTTQIGWRGFEDDANLEAVVVPTNDFQESIELIFSDYEKYKQIAIRNGQIVRENYSWEKVTQEFNKFVTNSSEKTEFYDPLPINHAALSYENRLELPWRKLISKMIRSKFIQAWKQF
jgi:glycosyltransferase involved in cell wall biosynthesis